GKGYRVELAETPVELVYSRESLSQFLRHQLRWKIALRNVRPSGHAAMAMTYGLPWTILAMMAARSSTLASLYLVSYLGLRTAVSLTLGVWELRDSAARRYWWLAPLRDAADFVAWLASFFSDRISWRGLEFRVQKGLLVPLHPRSLD